jgi:hypothetical protein
MGCHQGRARTACDPGQRRQGCPTRIDLHAAMRADTATDNTVLQQGDVEAAFAAAPPRQTVRFAAHGPYQAHAPFARLRCWPMCARRQCAGDLRLAGHPERAARHCDLDRHGT